MRCLALDDRWPTGGALCDLHTARLGCLGNRDPQREHALVVVGFETVGIEALADQELARERALRSFADD